MYSYEGCESWEYRRASGVELCGSEINGFTRFLKSMFISWKCSWNQVSWQFHDYYGIYAICIFSGEQKPVAFRYTCEQKQVHVFSVAVGGVSHSHNPSSLRIPDANEISGRLKGLWEGNKFSVAFTPSLLPVLLPSNLLPMHATMICFPFSWKAEDFPTYSVLPFNLEAQDFLFHIWGWSIL